MPGATFAEAADRQQTLSLLAMKRFSVILLDINMPESDGLDLLRSIRGLYPALPVILLGTQPKKEYARPCIQAGAAAYINLDQAPERLEQEVAKVLRGERNN